MYCCREVHGREKQEYLEKDTTEEKNDLSLMFVIRHKFIIPARLHWFTGNSKAHPQTHRESWHIQLSKNDHPR